MKNMKKLILLSTVLSVIFLFSCKEKKEHENLDFENSRGNIIKAEKINSLIKNGKDITIKNATILGNIDFTSSSEENLDGPHLIRNHVRSSVNFLNCTFKGKITAQKSETDYSQVTSFNKNITFIGCTFQDTVNFKSSQFNAILNIRDSEFQQKTSFEGALFYFNKNYFANNTMSENTDFNMAVFKGEISFLKTQFLKNVNFQMAKFHDIAQFSNTSFHENAEFSLINVNSNIFFNYSEFHKTISFNSAKFMGRTEFTNCKFNYITEFRNIFFYGDVKYDNSTFIGVVNFENSIFFISDITKQKYTIEKGTDFVFNNTKTINHQILKVDDLKNQ